VTDDYLSRGTKTIIPERNTSVNNFLKIICNYCYYSQSIGNRYADASRLHISRCMPVFNLTAKQELHPHEQNAHRTAGAQAAKQRVLRMWSGGL
jgi:hypothetical protein